MHGRAFLLVWQKKRALETRGVGRGKDKRKDRKTATFLDGKNI